MHVVIIDEAKRLFAQDANTISGSSSLTPVQGMGRSTKITMYVSSNSLRETSDALRSNVGCIIAFRPSDGRDALELQRTLNLTKEETEYLLSIPTGQVFVHIPRVGHPVHAASERVDATCTKEEFTAAINRTNAYLRERAINIAATRPTEPITQQAAPPQFVLTPTVAAPANLKTAEHCVLMDVAVHPAKTVIDTYRDNGLQAQQGDRIKKRLVTLGLITETRIKVGNGRGKEATALTATDVAYNMLGIKRPRVGRGGAQHAWCLRQLNDRIPHSAIEVNGADLAIAYNTPEHENVLGAIRRQHPSIALNTGDSIAIEVETDPSKTARQNLYRDRNYTLVIIAVFKDKVEAAKRIATKHSNAIVVDIFRLIEALT